jgi:hypothetical protein
VKDLVQHGEQQREKDLGPLVLSAPLADFLVMTDDEVFYVVRQKLKELHFLRLTGPLGQIQQETYEALCTHERELVRARRATALS